MDTVVFDKTGTLTERRAVVTEVMALPGNSQDELLAAAAAVEAESDHPIALAIMAASGSPRRGSDVQVLPGVGVAGLVDGQLVRVSRLEHPRLPEPLSTAIAARYARGETVVVVERGDDVLGAIAVTSPLRPEAKPSIRRLHEMGMRTAILSGDSKPAVVTAGAELGIDDVQAPQLVPRPKAVNGAKARSMAEPWNGTSRNSGAISASGAIRRAICTGQAVIDF